jgi:hypothetical protein
VVVGVVFLFFFSMPLTAAAVGWVLGNSKLEAVV